MDGEGERIQCEQVGCPFQNPNPPQPVLMDIRELARKLRDLANAIEAGECWEGSLEWHPSEDSEPTVEVLGAIRIGVGQGGMILWQQPRQLKN